MKKDINALLYPKTEADVIWLGMFLWAAGL